MNDDLLERDKSAKKRIVVITGATGGIGHAIARSVAGPNTVLILQGHSRETELQRLARSLREKTAGVETFVADLSNEAEQDELVTKIIGRLDYFNPSAISLLSWVNAAGTDLMAENIRDQSFDEKFRILTAVDITAVIRMSRKIGSWMADMAMFRKMNDPMTRPLSASILCFGWDGASRGMEGETGLLYATAKGAVIAFAKSLAQDLAPFVRVNVISPGWISTTWGKNAPDRLLDRGNRETLLGRWGTPEEIASTASFLISNRGAYINGQDIKVNGGYDYRPKTPGF